MERPERGKHMAAQVQKLAPSQSVARADSDPLAGSNKMVVDTVEDRYFAAVERGTAGRAERGLLALESEKEGCRQIPDSGVMDGENGGRAGPRAGIAGSTLVMASVDEMVAAAAVEVD